MRLCYDNFIWTQSLSKIREKWGVIPPTLIVLFQIVLINFFILRAKTQSEQSAMFFSSHGKDITPDQNVHIVGQPLLYFFFKGPNHDCKLHYCNWPSFNQIELCHIMEVEI